MTTEIANQEATRMDVFAQIEQMGHEQVVFCRDEATGLRAIIGVHNTVLGPSLGGLRMWPYESEQAALNDVLRLSRGMTFKNAIAGLHLGGGKAVIIGDSRRHKTEALLRAFGRFVERLNGCYITAEDVGMNAKDMELIAQETRHVSGLPESRGGLGDPSPFTAYSTYMGMKAAAKIAYGHDSLEGRKVSVQGVGHVGEYLIQYLQKENCQIFVTDVHEPRLKEVASRYGVKVVGVDEIYDLDVDIYSPSALGATINDQTLERLKCHIIAGCANNQLKDERRHGEAVLKRGMIYAPDFLVNSGGVTNVYAEVIKANKDWTMQHIEQVYGQTLEVLTISRDEQRNAQEVAMDMALRRIKAIAGIKTRF